MAFFTEKIAMFVGNLEPTELQGLTVGKIAREFNISRSKLYREFRLEQDTTPGAYLKQRQEESKGYKRRYRISEWVIDYIKSLKIGEIADLTVGNLACRFNMQGAALARIFKKEQGLKLSDYILEKKMEISEVILSLNMDITIGEVARLVGFSKPENFSRQFKKHKGTSPRRFRTVSV